MAHKKIIIANWKMNPLYMSDAKDIAKKVKHTAGKTKKVKTVICPPYIYLSELGKSASKSVSIGAQNVFHERSGAYTGEISPQMLLNMKIKWSIVGHSERRARGETNEDVNKKVRALLKEKIIPVICIGEKERDENAEYFSFLKKQIHEVLRNVPKSTLSNIVIAYEPVWAISSRSGGVSDSPDDTHEIVLFIKKILSELFSKKIALQIPILYGGSINQKNAEAFLENAGVDGLLVGSASLDKEQFSEILRIANSVS